LGEESKRINLRGFGSLLCVPASAQLTSGDRSVAVIRHHGEIATGGIRNPWVRFSTPFTTPAGIPDPIKHIRRGAARAALRFSIAPPDAFVSVVNHSHPTRRQDNGLMGVAIDRLPIPTTRYFWGRIRATPRSETGERLVAPSNHRQYTLGHGVAEIMDG